MRIDICKGLKDDTLTITRSNGSKAVTRFPKKGPIPHDGVHLIVERALSMRRAFWGYIAQGRHPEDIAKLAADAGHPSAKRASAPDVAIIELVQAERLVECFEAEVWGGAGDIAVLKSVADAAMFQSMVPSVPLPLDAVARIREELAAFSADWRALAVGESLSLDWPE